MLKIPKLTELEQDLLGELFNMGVGSAAASLSQMVQQEIKLSVPEVEFITVPELANHLGVNRTICSVSQQLDGPFKARSMLLFPEENSLEVVRKMLGQHLSNETVSELQQEALSEVGNVVLNACIGSFAKLLNVEFKVDLPSYELAKPSELLDMSKNSKDIILFIRINLTLSESEITGYLVYLFGSLSIKQLQDLLKEMLGNL